MQDDNILFVQLQWDASEILNAYEDAEFEVGRMNSYADLDGKKVLTETILLFRPGNGIYSDKDGEYKQYEIIYVINYLLEPQVMLHNLVSALS